MSHITIRAHPWRFVAMYRIGTAVAVALTSIALASCGTELSEPNPESTGREEVAASGTHEESDETHGGEVSESAEEILNAWGLMGADFDPLEDVRALETTSDLVLSGEVVEVVNGRIDGVEESGGGFVSRTVGIAIRVDEVVKGPGDPDQIIRVETPRGDMPIDVFDEALEDGTTVVAYLEPAPQSRPGYTYDSSGAGYPPGVDLWQANGPQALIFAFDDGPSRESHGVVSPLAGEVEPGVDPEDVLPD